MSIAFKRALCAVVLMLAALALARAATHRFQDAEEAFRKECQAQMKKQGLSTEEAKKKYPTPEVQMASGSVTPGGDGDLTIGGTFSEGSKFFVENDNIQIVSQGPADDGDDAVTGDDGEKAAGPHVAIQPGGAMRAQYRAKLQAAAGIGPETAAVTVINPRGQTARYDRAIRVCGRYEWTLEAANGWKLVARPQRTTPCPTTPDDTYDVSFFRKGETAAFEKVKGTANFSVYDSRNFRFNLEAPAAEGGTMQTYQALMQKMSDASLTPAQRDELMKKLEGMTKQLQAEMTMENVTKRAQEQQRKQQEFGCDSLALTVEAGKVTGDMRCSPKVGAGLTLTGTVALMK